jgi:hypothetical protein
MSHKTASNALGELLVTEREVDQCRLMDFQFGKGRVWLMLMLLRRMWHITYD